MTNWLYLDEYKIEHRLADQIPRKFVNQLRALPVNVIGDNCMNVVDNITDKSISLQLQDLPYA
jgi:hypothetical protein